MFAIARRVLCAFAAAFVMAGAAHAETVLRVALHSDLKIIDPMIRSSAKKYAEEKKLPTRDCAKEDGA